MPPFALPTSILAEDAHGDALAALERIVADTEAAELALAAGGEGAPLALRKESGSYYTPADVADHFWSLFLRHHRLDDAAALKAFIARVDLVEPSAGSGIFVFSFLARALRLGLSPWDLAQVRFHVVDINFAALGFLKTKLAEAEAALGIAFPHIRAVPADFLQWAGAPRLERVAFVGNPPFVANPRGSRWRNLYADFLETMLGYPAAEKAVSLILPLSVCFSRDYADLRRLILGSGLGISAASYDNIPDALFKAGKPESTNTNRANSQRCTILCLGGPEPGRREAASLLRWAVGERERVLGGLPAFHDWSGYAFDGQIPRPESAAVMRYLAGARGAPPVRALLSGCAREAFSLAGVARNFIGIREPGTPGSIPIRPTSEADRLVLLRIFASQLFYDYWRTVGDGFHVTADLVERFPVTAQLRAACLAGAETARAAWNGRDAFAKEKLNSGRIVRSYDLRGAFSALEA